MSVGVELFVFNTRHYNVLNRLQLKEITYLYYLIFWIFGRLVIGQQAVNVALTYYKSYMANSGYVATLAFIWSRVSGHLTNVSPIFHSLFKALFWV